MLSRVQPFVTPWTVAHQDPLSMGFFSGKNTGVGCHFFLQGIFPTQGSNSGLLHCRWILYLLSQWRSPARTLTRNKRSRVFCTANPVDRSPSIGRPQEKAQCPSLSRPIWLVHLGREELTLKLSSQKTGTREKIWHLPCDMSQEEEKEYFLDRWKGPMAWRAGLEVHWIKGSSLGFAQYFWNVCCITCAGCFQSYLEYHLGRLTVREELKTRGKGAGLDQTGPPWALEPDTPEVWFQGS